MDLILDILLFIEKHCNGIHDVPLQKDFLHSDDESEIMEHCRLIVEKNLATAQQGCFNNTKRSKRHAA